jgi:hypothetical protein
MNRQISLLIHFIVAGALLGVTLQLASAASRLISGEEGKGEYRGQNPGRRAECGW